MAEVAFTIVYVEEAKDELRALRKFDRQKIIDTVAAHLSNEPTKESRSRIKQMEQPFWSEYRLRIDEFRVYYNVDVQERVVTVLHVFDKGQEPTRKDTNHEDH